MERIRAMKDRGITLIELIIVISIIGILVLALGFQYSGWMGGYRVESQTKEMYVDLMNARARAMQRNRVHLVDFPSVTQYRIREDTNEDNVPDTILPSFPKTVQYTLNCNGAGILATAFSFDARGLVSPDRTLRFTLPANVSPDYDCIVMFATRINMGKWNATTATCEAK